MPPSLPERVALTLVVTGFILAVWLVMLHTIQPLLHAIAMRLNAVP